MSLFNVKKDSEKEDTLELCGVEFGVFNLTKKNVTLLEYHRFLSKLNTWEINNSWVFGMNRFYCYMLYRKINEILCVFSYDKSSGYIELYGMPVGDYSNIELYKATLLEAFDIIRAINGAKHKSRAVYLHDYSLNSAVYDMIKKDKTFRINKWGKWREFTNNLTRVSLLEGSDFSYLRRELKQFERKYENHLFRRYEPNDFDSALKLHALWTEQAEAVYGKDGVGYGDIFKFSLENHDILSHNIFVVEVDGEIKGVISYEELFDEHCACIFRVNDHTVLNLSKYMSYKIMEAAYNDGYMFMNDGGSPNDSLKSFKQKYRGEEYGFYNVHLTK